MSISKQIGSLYNLCPPCERRSTKKLIQCQINVQTQDMHLRKICRSCKRRFTPRTGTISENLKKDLNCVDMALHSLVKGGNIRGTAELVNVKPESVQRWLYRASLASSIISNEIIQEISPQLIQVDELWTYIYKKQYSKTDQDLDIKNGDEWIWVALAMPSRFIIAIHCGTRSQEDGNEFVQKIFNKINSENVIWMSDGLPQYLNALVKCYDEFTDKQSTIDINKYYGRVIKVRKDRLISEIYTEWVWGSEKEMDPILKEIGQSSLNTAYIERVNLTLRQEVSKLHRKGLGFSKTKIGLERHLEWFVFYYNFIRTHISLRINQPEKIATGIRKWKSQTPAMALGVSDRIWTIQDVLLTRIGKKIPLISTKTPTTNKINIKRRETDNFIINNQIKGESKPKNLINQKNEILNLKKLLSSKPYPILEILYTSGSGNKTERKISPLELSQKYNRWYIKAYCFIRNDERDFRIDRINQWKISSNTEGKLQIDVQKEIDDLTLIKTNNRKKRLKKHGNLHHSCCELVLHKDNFVQKKKKETIDNKNAFKGKISLTKEIETPEDFLKRMKDQIGLIIWQFLLFMYPSPQSRSDICEGTGLAWSTIYDTLVRLSEWNLVESQLISSGKRGRNKKYWLLKESSLDVYEDLYGDKPPPPEDKISENS